MRARPSSSGSFKVEKSEDGRLKILEQSGWRIEYLEFAGELPSRLRLVYPGVDLRLAISEWK